MTIGIQRHVPAERERVNAFILGIQRGEFGLPLSIDDQPDLLRVGEVYQRGGGDFWIAYDGEAIVGTTALIDVGGSIGALRKMFVAKSHRGREHGVGAALLATLLAHARANGISEIYLGTTAPMHAAHRFYEKNGFSRVDKRELPAAFPVMSHDTLFYRRAL